MTNEDWGALGLIGLLGAGLLYLRKTAKELTLPIDTNKYGRDYYIHRGDFINKMNHLITHLRGSKRKRVINNLNTYKRLSMIKRKNLSQNQINEFNRVVDELVVEYKRVFHQYPFYKYSV